MHTRQVTQLTNKLQIESCHSYPSRGGDKNKTMAPIRLLILSDTHDTAFPSWEFLKDNIPFANKKVDILLHCGDLTMIGGLSNYRRAISKILSIPAELRLVIPGNHDVSLDKKWWSENLIENEDDPDEAEKALGLCADAKNDGLVFLDEGIHTFTLEDGRRLRLYASPYTPEFGGYAFAYGPEEDRFNDGSGRVPNGEDMEVDIVTTHGPPAVSSHSKDGQTPESGGEALGYTLDLGRNGEHCGCDKLFRAMERAKPLVHCFGHIHEGYGAQVMDWETRDVSDAVVSFASGVEAAGEGGGKGDKNGLPVINVCAGERGRKTAFFNAAIMRHGEEEGNKPWIIELDV